MCLRVISVKGLGKGEKDVCPIEPFYDTSGEVKRYIYIYIYIYVCMYICLGRIFCKEKRDIYRVDLANAASH